MNSGCCFCKPDPFLTSFGIIFSVILSCKIFLFRFLLLNSLLLQFYRLLLLSEQSLFSEFCSHLVVFDNFILRIFIALLYIVILIMVLLFLHWDISRLVIIPITIFIVGSKLIKSLLSPRILFNKQIFAFTFLHDNL